MSYLRSCSGRFLFFVLALPSLLFSQEKEVTSQDLVAQWLHTERLLSQEATEWQEERDHIQQLLALYDKELTLLDEELGKAGQNAVLVDGDAEGLKKELAASEQARRQAIAFLAKFTPRLREFTKKLPSPLQEQLDVEILTLADPVTNSNAGDILRAVIKILQEAARFNRNYVFEEQELDLNGSPYRAKVMYLGLSQAFFLAGEQAGVLLPGDEGWTIQKRDDLVPSLKKAFAIQAKETPSAFFKLPLKR